MSLTLKCCCQSEGNWGQAAHGGSSGCRDLRGGGSTPTGAVEIGMGDTWGGQDLRGEDLRGEVRVIHRGLGGAQKGGNE